MSMREQIVRIAIFDPGFENRCRIFFLEIRSNLVSRPQNLNSATPIWSKSNFVSKNSSDFSIFSSIKILILH